MLRNYFIMAIRNIRKHPFLATINISGLAIGISAALVIYLMVAYELNFDNFHPDKENIYRVVSKIEFTDLTIHNSGVPGPTAAVVRKEVTGLRSVSHFLTANETRVTLATDGKKAPKLFRNQKGIIYTDPEYFDIITYSWIKGAPANALKEPFQVVLTKSRCNDYFPGMPYGEVMGKLITYDDSISAKVTGIVADLEGNSDFQFKEFISHATLESTGLKNFWSLEEWGSINDNSQMLVALLPGTRPQLVEQQIARIRDKYRTKDSEDPGRKDDTQHFLQPLQDLHFNAEYGAFNQRQAHKPTLYGLLAVAFFLLLLGCINFINLSTAQASTRAKEIGIRKTMGGSKSQLRWQFLHEALLLTLLATILSIAILPWILEVFGNFIPPAIHFDSINAWNVWLFLAILVLTVTFLSGYYPAIVLSGYQPASVLKNQVITATGSGRKQVLRKVLTVSQFMVAQFLLLATLIVSKQVHYSLNKDLGFKRDAIVFINTPWNWGQKEPDKRKYILMQQLRAIPEIEKISLGSSPPASNNTSSTSMTFNDGPKKVETMVEVKYADANYFDLYGMKLLAGSNLQESDTTKEYVINSAYARLMGFERPEEAVGHYIDRNFKIPIVGVLADFHTKSTHHAIKPLAYSASGKQSYTLHIGLRNGPDNAEVWKKAIAKMEGSFKSIYPENDFKYTFYDESIAEFYTQEQNTSSLLKWASGLCLLISSLGLLGLVIFTTNARTKEIGVRKVLGATVSQLVYLLSKDFLALVLTAFLIITPVAWLVMHKWLQNFAYRTDMNWWIFAVSGGIMLFIATVTLGFRTIRSASENPVKSLRSE